MALIFADGFEDGTLGWGLGSQISLGTGRTGSGLVCTSGGSSSWASTGFAPTAGPITCGFAFKPVAQGNLSSAVICSFMNTTSTIHISVARGSGGEIVVTRSAGMTVLGTSAVNVLPAGAWSYIEFKVVIHDTTGSVVVRVNGVQVLSLTNIDTRDGSPTTASGIAFGSAPVSVGMTATAGYAWDDVYIADGTGSYNNDFLGEISVEHLRPGADDTAQFVGSDGNSTNNYDLVDEAGAFAGADYVGSATIGQRDLYIPVASSRGSASPVMAVLVNAAAEKTDAGVRTAKLVVKEGAGGTLRYGSELGLPSSFGEIRSIFERKGDGSQFTVADVNALRFGMEVAT